MHLIEALIEAATGNNWHNCSWNSRTGRFCQEHGPSTRATYSGIRTSEVYCAGKQCKSSGDGGSGASSVNSVNNMAVLHLSFKVFFEPRL